jgi:membrane protein implicated in regulation of membrane protease activity
MEAWWEGISALNKAFAVGALFFGVLFLWQIVGMFLGLDSHHQTDTAHDQADMGHDQDGGDHQTRTNGAGASFSLVSIRSAIAFATLFTWAGTLYLTSGIGTVLALAYSFAWGLAAMFAVSYLVSKLVQLQEIGNASIWTAVGEEGSVYMNVPEGGLGKIRVKVSGAVSFVDARSADRGPLEAGTKVRVVGIVDNRTVEVVPMENQEGV